jgi:putative ATP-binding cassette transporter
MFTRVAHAWGFTRRAWRLAAPYWSSEERWRARILLTTIVALTETIRGLLEAAGLGSFTDRLDQVDNWTLEMSGGEQQRLAIARAVLQQPDWLFLDEATAALDDAAEQDMYSLLHSRLPNTAIVSIAHRSGVAAFHDRHVALTTAAPLLELAAD